MFIINTELLFLAARGLRKPMKISPAKCLHGWRESCLFQTKKQMEAVNGSAGSHSKSEHQNGVEGPPQKKAKIMPTDDVVLQFAKITKEAFAPTRGSKFAAGYDLYSAYDYTLDAQGKEKVKTDIQIAVPEGCYGRVAPRSGLAANHFIDVGAGVIDQDYRGNVQVILFNFGKEPFKVKKGDRIAQLIMEKICIPELKECETLSTTERGSDGFGSTGVSKKIQDSEITDSKIAEKGDAK